MPASLQNYCLNCLYAADGFLEQIGSNTSLHGPEPALGLSPMSHNGSVMRSFTEYIKQSLSKCRYDSKIFLAEPDHEIIKFLMHKARKDLKMIVGSITEHCTLNKHTPNYMSDPGQCQFWNSNHNTR